MRSIESEVQTNRSPDHARPDTSRLRHALFVVFHFPPEASSSGVLRTLKYAKYLADFGWRVTVLTLQRSAYEIVDETLEKQIPAGVKVIRTRYLNTKRHLSVLRRYPAVLAVPDSWIGWFPWAVQAGSRAYHTDPYDLIYSTSPHATAHLIAARLAATTGRPWVMDFRDPWYEEPPEPGTPWIVHWFARRLERRAVARATAIVTSTPQLRDDLMARYGDLVRNKIRCIFNGYDEADFDALPPRAAAAGGNLQIVHAGNINAEFRDPIPLFRALRHAADEGLIDLDKVRLRFIGPGDYASSAAVRSTIEQLGMQNQVAFEARIPYEQALEQIVSADLLLLMQASDDTVGLVPAKLFEYLRAGRPVMALVRKGAAQSVLEQTNGGWAIDPADESALQNAVKEVFESWSNGTLDERSASPEALAHYSRHSLTRELAHTFDAQLSSVATARSRRPQ